MFSYVFMKILESRPQRYDAGIRILSGGHATRIQQQIVSRYVRPGTRMLDVGCGTGSLLLAAAAAGAVATGVDISAGMLDVARQRMADQSVAEKVRLHHAGAVEIDSLFEENSFDLVVSTLVFSELYGEERALALDQIRRILKPGGTLIIAVEVRPEKVFRRLIYGLVRLPLAAVTYLICQIGTRAVAGIEDEVTAAGFEIRHLERSFLDSFAVLSAANNDVDRQAVAGLPVAHRPQEDRSWGKLAWSYIGRWFPCPVEPGLRRIGRPDRASPVLLTSNFYLTVRRVEKALDGLDAYLLVAPANGINVWCGACGGEFNTHSAIAVIRTSRINERVGHRRLILPQFSAPGIDIGLLHRETGWRAVFGPAYAKDLPLFLENPKTVFVRNRARFPLPFRLEMLFCMNALVWMVLSLVLLWAAPRMVPALGVLFWGAGLLLYAGYPLLPGNSGWLKAVVLSAVEVLGLVLWAVVMKQPALAHWPMMAWAVGVNLWLGFDLRGIVAGYPSEAEWLMHHLGMGSFGHIFAAGVYSPGRIHQDTTRCSNCRACLRVCPKGVYDRVAGNKVRIQRRQHCFACNACVVQCPEGALSLQ